MPRLQPAPGYMTAKEAIKMLEISDATLSLYVRKGWLKRYGPPGRKHLFYKRSEVEALVEERLTFDEYQEVLPVTFRQAASDDLAAIVDMDNRTFHAGITVDTYLRWLTKNPETFFVLEDSRKRIVGYTCLLPLCQETLDRFVRGEIGLDGITPEAVGLFESGRPLHVYVIALCVDPSCRSRLKHTYGASLVRGLFAFILELGHRGVEVETITARTYKPDGIRILRKMGIPQLRSPVPGKSLFSVRVADSGFPLLVRYSDALEQWKQATTQKG